MTTEINSNNVAKECNRQCWKMVNRKWELNCYICRKMCPFRFGNNHETKYDVVP